MVNHTISLCSIRIFYTILVTHSVVITASASLSHFHYKAAAVLPTYMHNNIPYVVLSREAYGRDKGTYDSFGGSRDNHEYNPTLTAARECAEEMISHATIGFSIQKMAHYIDPYHNIHTWLVIAQRKLKYALYLTRFDGYVDQFLKNFYAARNNAQDFKYREKDSIALVAWSALQNAIKQNRHTVIATVLDPYGRKPKQRLIKLRPILVLMLRPYFLNQHSEGDAKNPFIIRFYA